LALVAVSGRPKPLTSDVAIDWLEIRTPTPPEELQRYFGMFFRPGKTKVSGPGQYWSINL
jgi:hypothetical protein